MKILPYTILAIMLGSSSEALFAEELTTQKTLPSSTASNPIASNTKNIEIVFVIDTTGSMGDLIQGAKAKIWGIINDTLKNFPSDTNVKVGLVAYRDQGDTYVTELTPLSDDLDNIYSVLMDYQADGGGDPPEDVRAAMKVATDEMNWSKPSSSTSQIIFLVGDAPSQPYKTLPDTIVTAANAKQQGIIVNTIQCGNNRETKKEWQEIAKLGGGEYFAINQDGNTKHISTPFDEKLIELNQRLGVTYIPYGSSTYQKEKMISKRNLESKIKGATSEAQAERAINKSLSAYGYSHDDIVQSYENKTIDIKKLNKDLLPETMQKMTDLEKEDYIKKISEQRQQIKKEITQLAKQRDDYRKKQLKENSNEDSFDKVVSSALEKQIK